MNITKQLGGMVFISLMSACSLPKMLLPQRDLHIVLYTDGTCEYSFENMGSGLREDQKWEQFDSSDGIRSIFCRNRKVTYYKPITPPEIWPGVQITMVRKTDDLVPNKTTDGHVFFQPEHYRDRSKYSDRPSVSESNGSTWSVVVNLLKGTDANEERLPALPHEHYAICGTIYESTDNPNNLGLEYSEKYQITSGLFIEINTKVQAESAGC